MNKGKKLYEGKAKIIYETNQNGLVIQHFKDSATAFNALKKANIEGKGVLNNRISEYLLSSLSQCGVQTHLIKRLNMREQLVKEVKIIPIEFVVRNIATGSLTKRLGISEGTSLENPLLEYYLFGQTIKRGFVLFVEGHTATDDYCRFKLPIENNFRSEGGEFLFETTTNHRTSGIKDCSTLFTATGRDFGEFFKLGDELGWCGMKLFNTNNTPKTTLLDICWLYMR